MEAPVPLQEEDRLWLKALDVSVWRGFADELKGIFMSPYAALDETTPLEVIMNWIREKPADFEERPRDRQSLAMRRLSPARPMTEEEWKKVCGIIQQYSLICALGTGPYGGLYLSLFAHSPSMEQSPEWLTLFFESHLPGCFDIRNGSYGKVSDKGWEAFNGIASSPRNLAYLQFYKFDLPKSRSHYDY